MEIRLIKSSIYIEIRRQKIRTPWHSRPLYKQWLVFFNTWFHYCDVIDSSRDCLHKTPLKGSVVGIFYLITIKVDFKRYNLIQNVQISRLRRNLLPKTFFEVCRTIERAEINTTKIVRITLFNYGFRLPLWSFYNFMSTVRNRYPRCRRLFFPVDSLNS